MKKLLGSFLVLCMLIGLAGISFSEENKAYLSFLEEKLSKIETYIGQLEDKLIDAEAAQNWKRIKELKKLLAKQKKRAEAVKSQIAEEQRKIEVKPVEIKKEEVVVTKPSVVPAKPAKRGIVIEGGTVGGAGVLGVAYRRSIRPNLELKIGAGYGIGNAYNVMLARISGIFKIDLKFFDSAGLSLDYGNYSEKVEDITGILGNISKGSNLGAGLFVGRTFGDWQVELGYSTALWPTLTIGYTF